MVKFETSSGEGIYINPDHIIAVEPVYNEMAPEAKIVTIQTQQYYVKYEADEVIEMIDHYRKEMASLMKNPD